MTPEQVREARPEEYPAIAQLMAAAYQEYAPALSQERWEGYRNDLMDVAGRSQRGAILVADVDGRLAGCVTYYPHTLLSSWRWWPADYAYLRALGVDPGLRGHGVGTALTLACIDRARAEGAAGIALNTTSLMPKAQALYEHLGFHQVFSGNPDDAEDQAGFFSYVRDLSYS